MAIAHGRRLSGDLDLHRAAKAGSNVCHGTLPFQRIRPRREQWQDRVLRGILAVRARVWL